MGRLLGGWGVEVEGRDKGCSWTGGGGGGGESDLGNKVPWDTSLPPAGGPRNV